MSLRNFYIRRALRLIPALVLLLAAWLAYAFWQGAHGGRPWWLAGSVLFYCANWLQAFRIYSLFDPHAPPYLRTLTDWTGYARPLTHTWSLSIEEQFYLLWPCSLLVLLRLGLRRWLIVGLVLGAAAASSLWRSWLWSTTPDPWIRVFCGSDTRADGLLVGCATAMLARWGGLPGSPRAVVGLGLLAGAALVPMAYMLQTAQSTSEYLYAGGATGFALGVAAILAVLIRAAPGWALGILEWAPLTWIGRRSYGLYLWHWLVYACVESTPVRPALVAALQLAAAFAVAAVSFRFVEQPFLRLKARYV